MSMLEVVQFENGKYGLRNAWTGFIIDQEFRTVRGALRYGRVKTKRLNTVIHKLTSSIRK